MSVRHAHGQASDTYKMIAPSRHRMRRRPVVRDPVAKSILLPLKLAAVRLLLRELCVGFHGGKLTEDRLPAKPEEFRVSSPVGSPVSSRIARPPQRRGMNEPQIAFTLKLSASDGAPKGTLGSHLGNRELTGHISNCNTFHGEVLACRVARASHRELTGSHLKLAMTFHGAGARMPCGQSLHEWPGGRYHLTARNTPISTPTTNTPDFPNTTLRTPSLHPSSLSKLRSQSHRGINSLILVQPRHQPSTSFHAFPDPLNTQDPPTFMMALAGPPCLPPPPLSTTFHPLPPLLPPPPPPLPPLNPLPPPPPPSPPPPPPSTPDQRLQAIRITMARPRFETFSIRGSWNCAAGSL